MQRTVNFKAVAILTLFVALSGVTVHFMHGYQLTRHSRELIEQANRAERDGQSDEAAGYLAEYLGLAPHDVDAQCKYALLIKELAKTPRQKLRAFYLLEGVLRRYTDRDDVRRAAAELGLQFGRFEESRKYLDALYQSSPKDADLAILLGRCEFGAFNYDKSTRWFLLATELAPERIALSVDVAATLRDKRLDRRSVADEVMDNLANRGRPTDAAHEAAARYYAQHGELAKAEKLVQAALAGGSAPSADLLILAAEVLQRLGRRDEVRQHLERGLQSFPKDHRLAQRIAQIDLIEGNREQAKARMETVLQAAIERPEDIFNAAEILIELGQLAKAGELIGKLKTAKADAPAHLLQGRLLMKKSEWGAARVELEMARSAVIVPSLAKILYAWLAECYGQMGFADQELIAYRRSVDFDRSWVPARRGLAFALSATGQLDSAIDEYRGLVAEAPDVRSELARLLLIRAQRLPPGQRNYDEIEQLLHPINGTDQPAPARAQVQAEVLLAKGKPEDARKLMQAECDRDPTQTRTWLTLANLANRTGSADADLTVLADAEKQVGPRVEWELARARHWLRVSPADASMQMLKLEPRAERFPGADGVRLLAGLAECYKGIGEAQAARRLWRQIADRAPDNLAVRSELFEFALQTGADAEADKYLGEIRRIEGANGPLAAYGEAARYIARAARGDASALAAASSPLAKAVELSPTWSRVLTLQAQVFDLSGRPDNALEKYQEAIARGDSRLGVVRRTLQLLYQQRRYAEANVLVGKLSKQSLMEANLGRLVAQLLVVSPTEEGSDPKPTRQRALDLARQSINADSRDVSDYLWLAQVAAIADQPSEAENALRQAVRLEPSAPDAWVMLVSLLAKVDPKRADAEIETARQTLPRDQVSAVLAPCMEALGRTKDAEEQYKAALVARPAEVSVLRNAANFFTLNGHPDKAVPLLRKLIEPGARTSDAILTWARRTLAMNIATSGDYQQYREALTLIEANGTGTVNDRLAKAIILAMQPANRRDAIRLFEETSPQLDSVSPDVRFVIAQLYEADGHWQKARVYMLALVNEFDKNPAYLSRYIRGLLRHDGTEEAGKWVGKLAALSPDSLEAAELKARVLKAQERPVAETVKPVLAYARGKDARPELAAEVLEELGAPSEAEAIYRQFAAASPRPHVTLAFAVFLSRHQRLPEALALCDWAWATCPAEAVAATSVTALRVGEGNAAQQRHVEQLIEAAIAKNPQSTMLPTFLAMMYEAADRPADAVARYRSVLRQDPRTVVAMNNLACLLTLHENKSAEALTLINQAIDLAGPDAQLLDSRALIYLRAGQAGLALRDINQAIVQVPMPSKTLNFRLAQAHHANKNRAGAIEAMTNAKKLGLQATDLAITERPAYHKLIAELDLN
jgi:cellulose synthase operon protein C